jgi:hypothetical protein
LAGLFRLFGCIRLSDQGGQLALHLTQHALQSSSRLCDCPTGVVGGGDLAGGPPTGCFKLGLSVTSGIERSAEAVHIVGLG